jgi:hypothetical protein
VLAAASETNTQSVANNHRPDRMGSPLLCLGVDSRAEEHSPPLLRTLPGGAALSMPLEHFFCCGSVD